MKTFFKEIYLIIQSICSTMYDRTIYIHQKEDGTFEELYM